VKTVFRTSFVRDLQIRQVIEEVENITNHQGIGKLKKMTGSENFYRIKVSDYRIGIIIEANEVAFVRCLHRSDIYRLFP